jgi:hypothetical protein
MIRAIDDEGETGRFQATSVELRTFNHEPFLKCVQKSTNGSVHYETLQNTTINSYGGALLSAFVSARFLQE